VPDVALDGLLREEETVADLAVHEALRDELKHLDLAGGRGLLERRRARVELDHLGDRGTPRRHRVEALGMLAIPRKNLVSLGSVHTRAIDRSIPLL
jgi:hypothetical protein